MEQFEVSLGDFKIYFPKIKLIRFFVQNPALFNTTGYAIRNPVPVAVFRAVAASIIEGTKLLINPANAAAVASLAEELSLDELLEGSSLSDRISRLENDSARYQLESVPLVVTQLRIQEREIEHLTSCVSTLEAELLAIKYRSVQSQSCTDIHPAVAQAIEKSHSDIRTELVALGCSVHSLETNLCNVKTTLSTLPADIDCPILELNSLNGIIEYLSKKCKGNVHDLKIVNVRTKSCDSQTYSPPRNLVNLTDRNFFMSSSRGEQWICYEFIKMRVRPTHYSIRTACNTWDGREAGFHPKSWFVQTSLDAKKWIEVDRQTNVDDMNFEFMGRSFALGEITECRYIRFTQTQNHKGDGHLALCAFEIFGTLIQSRE
jgi:hypothetical protein